MKRQSKKKRGLTILTVHAVSGARTRGTVQAGSQHLPCALGTGGISHDKREGDGCTPAGRWRVLGGYFRPDRLARPRGWLAAASRGMGWCDASGHPLYNRRVRLPFSASHEALWREDGVYDILVVLDYNFRVRKQHRGSAIFFHLARENFSPTAGCVAIRLADMRRLLPRLSKNCVMVVK